MPPKPSTSDYSAQSLKLIEGLEHVRTRPGMYIGSTQSKGLHHMVWEILDNSIDEHMAGHGSYIEVEITEDGWCKVTDQARGIPVDIHEESGMSGVELVLTKLGGGGKFNQEGSGYSVSGGLHGVGASVVNALSTEMRVIVHRDGYEHTITFKKGIPQGKIKKGKKVTDTGTTTSFLYDDTIMAKGMKFDSTTIATRLRELCYLNPGLRIKLIFPGRDDEEFYAEGGLSDFVRHEVTAKGFEAVHKAPLYFGGEVEDTIEDKDGNPQPCKSTVDLALQWTDSDRVDASAHSFVNSINTPDGGTHVKGVETALRKVLNEVNRDLGRFKAKEEAFERGDVREGLIWVILIRIPNPRFESQTKVKLDNPEVEKRVELFIGEHLRAYLMDRKNREIADQILDRITEARDARIAAKRAKDANKVERRGVFGGGLPGKLDDCSSRDNELTELFLVEGESAAGNMVTARNADIQAVLAMRGKVLNAAKGGDGNEGVLKSQAIKDILLTIGGTSIPITIDAKRKGKIVKETRWTVDVSDRRYGKIVLCCDADVDGGHIVTLLLTFFLNMTPQLLRDGRIYIADLPLFRIEHKDKKIGKLYLWSEEDLKMHTKKGNIKTNKHGDLMVTRFKGLGEMTEEELEEMAFNPETRRLKRVVITDHNEAEDLTDLLMGSKVEPRFNYIQEHALEVEADG